MLNKKIDDFQESLEFTEKTIDLLRNNLQPLKILFSCI